MKKILQITLITIAMLFLTACTTVSYIEEHHSAAGSKYVLENGINIIMKERQDTGLVSIVAMFKVSLAQEPKQGMNNFISKIILRGTEKRTGEEILSQIENAGGSITSRTFAEYNEISIVIPSNYLSVGLEIMQDIIMKPALSEEEFEKVKTKILDEIKTKEDDPNIVAEELFMKALFSEHPYGNSIDGTEESIKSINKKELEEYYKKWFSPNNMYIGIVGNFEQKPVVNALAFLFKNFKKQPYTEELTPAKPITEKKELTSDKPLQSFFINQGYLLPSVTNPDFIKMRVVTSTLGSGISSRMFKELRGKRGLAYTAYAKQPSVRTNSFIKMAMIVSPKVLNQSLEGIQELIDQIKTEKMTEEEMTHVKNKIKGFYLLDRQESRAHANLLAFFEMQGLGYEYDTNYIDFINTVTIEDVYEISNKYFNNPAIAITGPFSSEGLFQ